MSHLERIVPDDTEPGVVALHLKRYAFASPTCEGKVVLDLGCGVGYGTHALADVARSVVGIDVDEQTIDYARSRYGRANVEFQVADAAALPMADGSFDVVCCFEAVEHVDDPPALVREAGRVLRDGGTLFISTPQVGHTTTGPENPFHTIEYARLDFEALLRAAFADVVVLGEQRVETRRHRLLRRLDVLGLRRRVPAVRRASVLTGTEPTASVALEGIVIGPEQVDRAPVLYAVCTQPRR